MAEVSPALIMFHGGGWMIGDIKMHRRFYSNIAHYLNMVVISPEYNRSPDAGVPLAAYKHGFINFRKLFFGKIFQKNSRNRV